MTTTLASALSVFSNWLPSTDRWFKTLDILGRSLSPVVQGGMGVGVFAHRLAGAVARENAIGTIASIDLRHHHPDLLEQTEKSRDRDLIDRVNLIALDREIQAALLHAQGRGLIAVNVMKAVPDHPALVRQACESGAHAIVMGAGLPIDLPEMVADYPKVGLIPILSESRGVAIVIEHPGYAGGHLGAVKIEDIQAERFEFERVIAECQALFLELGLGRDAPPLILAGGIDRHEKVRYWLNAGADAVQLGTAFAVSEEGDAHIDFKRVLLGAIPSKMLEIMSVAGLPMRAVSTHWLRQYQRQEPKMQASAKADPRRCSQRLDCLTHCGLRDGNSKAGQFCIDLKLAAALKGDVQKGLFFRGAGRLPFGDSIRPVKDLIEYLLHGHPCQTPA